MSRDNIKLSEDVITEVNNRLGENFLESIEATSNREIIVNTGKYGSITYPYDDFFGEPIGSAHSLIKYEVYNEYLEGMNIEGKELYELLEQK